MDFLGNGFLQVAIVHKGLLLCVNPFEDANNHLSSVYRAVLQRKHQSIQKLEKTKKHNEIKSKLLEKPVLPEMNVRGVEYERSDRTINSVIEHEDWFQLKLVVDPNVISHSHLKHTKNQTLIETTLSGDVIQSKSVPFTIFSATTNRIQYIKPVKKQSLKIYPIEQKFWSRNVIQSDPDVIISKSGPHDGFYHYHIKATSLYALKNALGDSEIHPDIEIESMVSLLEERLKKMPFNTIPDSK